MSGPGQWGEGATPTPTTSSRRSVRAIWGIEGEHWGRGGRSRGLSAMGAGQRGSDCGSAAISDTCMSTRCSTTTCLSICYSASPPATQSIHLLLSQHLPCSPAAQTNKQTCPPLNHSPASQSNLLVLPLPIQPLQVDCLLGKDSMLKWPVIHYASIVDPGQ